MAGKADTASRSGTAEEGLIEVDYGEFRSVETSACFAGLDIDYCFYGCCLDVEFFCYFAEVLLAEWSGMDEIDTWDKRCMNSVAFKNNICTTERINVDVLPVVHVYCVRP